GEKEGGGVKIRVPGDQHMVDLGDADSGVEGDGLDIEADQRAQTQSQDSSRESQDQSLGKKKLNDVRGLKTHGPQDGDLAPLLKDHHVEDVVDAESRDGEDHETQDVADHVLHLEDLEEVG